VSRSANGTAGALSRPQQSLVDLLDRTLGAGVVVAGDVTLSVADVDLVYLNLRALLASVASLEANGIAFPAHGGSGVEPGPGRRPSEAKAARAADGVRAPVRGDRPDPALRPRPDLVLHGERRQGDPPARDRLERGLAQLVLTVVELLRDLMERQAIRRVDAGTLDPEQVDRLGTAFDRLERQMVELKKHFEFDDDDLTLRLAPLTEL